MNYKIFKSIETDDYIAIIYFSGFDIVSKIRKEIEDNGFTITDDAYEEDVIVLWLKKNQKNDKQYYKYKYILSVTPQEACNILNHKQDILIRKNVLKEMKP